MAYKIILGVLVAAQILSAGLYILLIKPGFSKKTFITKTICSTIFVLTGVFATLYSGNFSTFYAKIILIALVCSWIGDVFLHGNPENLRIIIGGLGFLAAHILYIVVFVKTANDLYGSMKVFSLRPVIMTLMMFTAMVLLYFALNLKAGKLLVPIAIYALVLCFMFSRALILGVILIKTGAVAAGLMTAIGATLFVASDATLGISFLGKKQYIKQAINVAAYFPAQMLLALSIAFI